MKTVTLITGGGSGIGLALSQVLAKNGHDLVLIARNLQELQKVGQDLEKEHGIVTYPLAADLSKPGACQKRFDELTQQKLEVNILVNNAGFATHGSFAESDTQAEMDMLEVNIKALTLLTRIALPSMLKKKSGYILNLASTAAFQPGPFMAGYYASKAYVLSFSEALNNELSGTGISVTALCPRPTKTGFAKRANIENVRLFKNAPVMEAFKVAEIGYRGMLAKKAVVIPGHRNTLIAISTRFAPRGLAARITRKLQED